jgi:hypothetical protein
MQLPQPPTPLVPTNEIEIIVGRHPKHLRPQSFTETLPGLEPQIISIGWQLRAAFKITRSAKEI